MKGNHRFLSVVGAVHLSLVAGCFGEGAPDPEQTAALNEQQLVLGGYNRRSFAPTACWVYDPAKVRGFSPTRFWAETEEIEEILAQWEDASGLDIDWVGDSGIDDGHECSNTASEDIRILLYNRDVNQGDPIPSVPGGSCAESEDVGKTGIGNPVEGDFGSFPQQGSTYAGCTYNARIKLNFGPGLIDTLPGPASTNQNQYLHEFGHTLGLAHEHDRVDNDSSLCPPLDSTTGLPTVGTIGPPNSPYLTEYDVNSVMHYNWDGSAPSPWQLCPAPGNWGRTGLSEADRLGIEMVYPATYEAVIRGGRLFRDDQPIDLTFDWIARGGNPDWLANPRWILWQASGGPALAVLLRHSTDWAPWPADVYRLQTGFKDGFGDTHESEIQIEVVSPSEHTARLAPAIFFL